MVAVQFQLSSKNEPAGQPHLPLFSATLLNGSTMFALSELSGSDGPKTPRYWKLCNTK